MYGEEYMQATCENRPASLTSNTVYCKCVTVVFALLCVLPIATQAQTGDTVHNPPAPLGKLVDVGGYRALTWCIGCAALRRTIPGRSCGYGVCRSRDDTSKKHVDAPWSDAASPSSKRCNRPTSDGASQALNSQWRRTRGHGH